MKRNSGKRDLTEGAIVNALTKAGCDVEYAERRPYDVIVGRAGATYLLEIKSRLGRIRESQVAFQAGWRGHYAIVRTPTEALRAVGLLT